MYLQKGKTPIKKNEDCRYALKEKGEAPIEKNVIVIDENGNEYETTYTKRAKGLVKKGRARFVDENKICLLCPPNSKSEDINMSEFKSTKQFSVDYIVKQIVKVQDQLLDLKSTVKSISSVADGKSPVAENASAHDEIALKKIEAITDVFDRREESLQRLLELYSRMYDDLSGKKVLKDKALAALEKCSGNDAQMEKLSGVLNEIGFLEE